MPVLVGLVVSDSFCQGSLARRGLAYLRPQGGTSFLTLSAAMLLRNNSCLVRSHPEERKCRKRMISKASKIRAESMADRRACRSRLRGLALIRVLCATSEAKNNRATRNVLFKTKAMLEASRRGANSRRNETPPRTARTVASSRLIDRDCNTPSSSKGLFRVDKQKKTAVELEDIVKQRIGAGDFRVTVHRNPDAGWHATIYGHQPAELHRCRVMADTIAPELCQHYELSE
jgi:hypothetical protein